MILCVHIHNGLEVYKNEGRVEKYDFAIRQAWKLNKDEASKITKVVGFVSGKVVAVLENFDSVELSTEINNKFHEPRLANRFVFTGGELHTELNVFNLHPLVNKKFSFGMGHRYIDVNEVHNFIK